MGRPKAFKTPEDLWKAYLEYKEDILANPIKVTRWVGKDAHEREEIHYKPPTWKGFEAFLHRAGYIYDLDDYRRNVGRGYDNYQGIIRAIGAEMFDRKFSGAAVGIYQHNIIARELGLADVQEVQNFQRPILENGKELPSEDEDDLLL
jgi:hypothetical protein